MTSNSKQILDQALALSPIERAELVEQLLNSFEFPARKKVDSLWAEEVEDRIGTFEQEELTTKSEQQVFENIDRQK